VNLVDYLERRIVQSRASSTHASFAGAFTGTAASGVGLEVSP